MENLVKRKVVLYTYNLHLPFTSLSQTHIIFHVVFLLTYLPLSTDKESVSFSSLLNKFGPVDGGGQGCSNIPVNQLLYDPMPHHH